MSVSVLLYNMLTSHVITLGKQNTKLKLSLLFREGVDEAEARYAAQVSLELTILLHALPKG